MRRFTMFFTSNFINNNMEKVVTITLKRFEELTMLHNTNRILEAQIEELLKEIRELKKNVRDKSHK